MKNILTLMRSHQYVKNLFIFLPQFFSGNFQNITMLFNASVVFIGFSVVASAIYIF
jgi:decaprenyl-phosphate phosphoribosyltransferase